MKSLQKFRKDELVLQEESDDDIGASDDHSNNKEQNSVEEAFNLVTSIDQRMQRLHKAIRVIDKRISYNYRLIGSVVPIDYQHLLKKQMNPSEDAKKGEEQNLDEKVKQQLESDMQDIQEIMERIPFQMRKQIILPKTVSISTYNKQHALYHINDSLISFYFMIHF